MAAVCSVTLLLLCCSVVSSTDVTDSCVFAKTGSTFVVPLNVTLQPSSDLRWKFNDVKIFHRNPTRLIKGNGNDVDGSGSLRLTNVQKSSTGTYTPEVFDDNGHSAPNLRSVRVCVQDPVPKPGLTVECVSESAVKFTCLPGRAPQPTFQWTHNGVVLGTESGRTLVRDAVGVPGDSFSCIVSNRVSRASSDAREPDCSRKLFGLDFWIMVGILAGGGGFVVLLVVVVVVCCVCARRRKRGRVEDEEEFRLRWARPEPPPHGPAPPSRRDHPCPQHHPAGHTGPRQQRRKQQRDPQRPRGPSQPNPKAPGQVGGPAPLLSSSTSTQGPRPVGNVSDGRPPPVPQPRKKVPRS